MRFFGLVFRGWFLGKPNGKTSVFWGFAILTFAQMAHNVQLSQRETKRAWPVIGVCLLFPEANQTGLEPKLRVLAATVLLGAQLGLPSTPQDPSPCQ